MIIKVSFTSVEYTTFQPDDKNPEIAYKRKAVLNIYEGRVTDARIAREIPNGATVETVTRINKQFEVDGEKCLDWLIENGKMKK